MNSRIKRKLQKRGLWPHHHHINLYEIDRRYGGPEEGGWWFDTGTPIQTLGKFRRNGNRFQDKLNLADKIAADMNYGRYPLSSVLSDGVVRVFIEPHKPIPWPERMPHYA